MTDIIDAAQALEERQLEQALARHRDAYAHGATATHCDDCGERIPAARRRAVAGVRRCIHCQGLAER